MTGKIITADDARALLSAATANGPPVTFTTTRWTISAEEEARLSAIGALFAAAPDLARTVGHLYAALAAERAAIAAYVERLHDMIAAQHPDQPLASDVLYTLCDAIESGAHLDTPETRCEARTTAPTGEE